VLLTDAILVSEQERCRDGDLSRSGEQNLLTLVEPLHESFQAGYSVIISNTVRYYLSKNRTGALMREVDGGANPLMNHVTSFRLTYVDHNGKPTSDLDRIARIRIALALEGQPGIVTEVGLQGAR
jgi:hypothetical protein